MVTASRRGGVAAGSPWGLWASHWGSHESCCMLWSLPRENDSHEPLLCSRLIPHHVTLFLCHPRLCRWDALALGAVCV